MQYRNYLPRIPLWRLVLTYCKSGAEGNRIVQPNDRFQSDTALSGSDERMTLYFALYGRLCHASQRPFNRSVLRTLE